MSVCETVRVHEIERESDGIGGSGNSGVGIRGLLGVLLKPLSDSFALGLRGSVGGEVGRLLQR